MTTPTPPKNTRPGAFDRLRQIKQQAEAARIARQSQAEQKQAVSKDAAQKAIALLANGKEARRRQPRTTARHLSTPYTLRELRPMDWDGCLLERVVACDERRDGSFELLLEPSKYLLIVAARQRQEMKQTIGHLKNGSLVFAQLDYDDNGQLEIELSVHTIPAEPVE